MNHKIWLASICLGASLFASQDVVKITTLQADANPDGVVAKKRVVVEYKDYYIQAQRAQYDKKKGLIRLFGQIYVLADGKYSALGQFALLDLKTDHLYANPFFFNETSSKVWITGSRLEAQKEKIELSQSFISSCDVGCPDWKFYFAHAKLDQKKHWIDLYNIKFYANDIPIFYFPYVGFSTLKSRQSGFLRPKMGLSDNEGFIYIQPYYYAPTNWWDLEIDPQIRTKRGEGLYSIFRFVDTPYSYGSIKTGFFDERSSYVEDKNLRNDKHYGLELYYKRRYFWSQPNGQSHDGLYIDSKTYNDIDYFNLQKSEDIEGLESLVTSRYNYFFDIDNNYFGINAKYFKDNRKEDNSDTLQLLPSLQYHRYTTSFINEHFSYDIDAKINHFYRKKGLNAIEYQLSLPVRFHYSLFDDFLGFSISEKLFANYADYNFVNKHLNKHWDNSHIYRNTHQISFFSDLVKGYESFFHTVHLDATLDIPSFEKKGGDKAPFINIEDNSKRLNLSLKEYFYNSDGDEILYHRLLQPINYEADRKWQDLENELGFSIGPNIIINSDIFYSHQRGKFSSIVTTVGYNDEKYDLFLSHFYKDRVAGEEDSNFLRFEGSRALGDSYKLFGTIDYDLHQDNTINWSIGWHMKRACWSYEITFKQEKVPVLTTMGSSSYENRTLYFKVELYPLGGISHSIQKRQERRIF